MDVLACNFHPSWVCFLGLCKLGSLLTYDTKSVGGANNAIY